MLIQITPSASVPVNDLIFGLADVIKIIIAVTAIVSWYFWFKYKIAGIEAAATRAAEAHRTRIRTNELKVAEVMTIVKEVQENHGGFKKEIFSRLDEGNKAMHDLSLGIEKMKSEILSKIIENHKN